MLIISHRLVLNKLHKRSSDMICCQKFCDQFTPSKPLQSRMCGVLFSDKDALALVSLIVVVVSQTAAGYSERWKDGGSVQPVMINLPFV